LTEKDLFKDLSQLRLKQDFGITAAAKKLVTTVPVDKPGKQDYFRVRPGSEWKLTAGLLTLERSRVQYLVMPDLHLDTFDLIKPMLLVLCVNRQKSIRLWPLRIVDDSRVNDAWASSAMTAAEEAETSWIKMAANMGEGRYDTFKAMVPLDEPEWPDMTLEEIFSVAFKGRVITSLDHIVLRELRGEV
jgi:hypothetical protein